MTTKEKIATGVISVFLWLCWFGIANGQNLNESLINTSVYTGTHLDLEKYNSGWGMPIPMQVQHIRKDGRVPGLVHVTTTDFGMAHSYTYNMPGSQVTFENSNKTTFGLSSTTYIRPINTHQSNIIK